jgi:protein phosphatase
VDDADADAAGGKLMPVLEYAAATDAGAVRELNEDAVVAASPLFAVADGMGGHAAGEVAAALAVEQLARLAGTARLHAEQLMAAVTAANQAILDWSARRPETVGMGTTISGVCLGDVAGSPHWFVFNVGDSRVYRYLAGEFEQVTVDHSVVQELVDAGAITRGQAENHPDSNVITRAIGFNEPPMPDYWMLPLEPGLRLLACSDGLSKELSDEAIHEALAAGRPAEETAAELVRAALESGGRDNVTVVLVDVLGVESEA